MKKPILLFTAALLLSMASAFAQGGTTGPLTWNINNGTLTISGEGAMPDYYWGVPKPWYEYKNDIHTLVIENGVTTIGLYAFIYFSNLTSVSIANTVLSIGESAFEDCKSLPTITFPDGLISIDNVAFAGCTALSSVFLSKTVAYIKPTPFSACYGLISIEVDSENNNFASENGVLFNKDKTVLTCYPAGKSGAYVIPNSVTSIGETAFATCTALAAITIPNSVKSIGGAAFYSCTNLSSLTIPNSVTSIGVSAFRACKNLSSITIPNSVIRIEDATFYDCTSLTSITIPNSVTSIGGSTFRNCTSLTSITIPNNVTSIETCTFMNCSSLTSIIIPNSVTSIRGNAFHLCASLTSVTIPKKVTTIDSWAFASCKKLKRITNLNPVPVDISNTVFDSMNQDECTLEVPMGSVDAYKEAYEWNEFKIKGIEVGIETLDMDIKIFPNPTLGELRITNYELGITNVEIFDMYGRKHEGTKARRHENETTIDISHLTAGIYFIKLTTEYGTFTKKIIKN